MARSRFNNIWSEIQWDNYPNEITDEMSHGEYRWSLIDDTVNIFNKHREDSFIPSEWICVEY